MKAIILGSFLTLQIAQAQSVLGSISGRVTDAKDAAIPGAQVTLTDRARHIVQQTVTGAEGTYGFMNLPAASYELAVSHPGLADARAEFELLAREARRFDLRLEVRPRFDHVELSADVPTVNAVNGALSDSKNFEQVAGLPFNYRASDTPNPIFAIYAMPGVNRDDISLAGSFNGSLLSQTEYSIDGITSSNIRFSSVNFSTYPSSEMLSEVQMNYGGNGIELSRATEIALTTRSGTNDVHGAASWYHQNRALDAADYYYHTKGVKVFNNFAVALGGPVRLPGLYNGRNRTFYFLDYEGDRRPLTRINPLFVPTKAWRAGLLDGVPGGAVTDPSTGAPFPGNRIPPSQINTVSAKLLDRYVALPDTTPPETNPNYIAETRSDGKTDRYDTRLDQAISGKQRIFGRWSWSYSRGAAGADPLPYKVDLTLRTRTLAAGHTYAVHPALSNEFRFGLDSSESTQTFPVRGKDIVADLGLRGVDLSSAGDSGGFPSFDFSDATGFASFGMGRDWRQRNLSWQFTDTISWVRGRHSMRFGFDIRKIGTIYARTTMSDFGSYFFQSGLFTGNAFADLLLGYQSQSSTANTGPVPDLHGTTWAFFAQDTYQMSRSFTLTVGLRWSATPPLREEHGNMGNFHHSTGAIIVPDSTLPAAPAFLSSIGACEPGAPKPGCTQVLTASQAGLPEGLRTTDWSDWQPRASFAWRPFGPRTVFRGGAGVFMGLQVGVLGYGMTGMHTSDLRTYINAEGANGSPLFALPDTSAGESLLPPAGTATIRSGTDPTFPDWRSSDWNITAEHELRHGALARVTYHGLVTSGYPIQADFNQVEPSSQPYSASRRPFAGYAALLSAEPLGFVNYQGIQVVVEQRPRNGFFYQASYTFAKDLTNSEASNSGLNPVPVAVAQTSATNRFHPRLDRGNMQGLRSNSFQFNAIAPLPIGRGRRLGTDWRGLREILAGGWVLSTVTASGTGVLQTATMPRGWDSSNTSPGLRNVWPRPDAVAGADPNVRSGDSYYTATAFSRPPRNAGRFGTAAPGTLVGPSLFTVSLGASKTTALGERFHFRVEASFINALNHPNFTRAVTDISQPMFGVPLSTINPRSGQIGARLTW